MEDNTLIVDLISRIYDNACWGLLHFKRGAFGWELRFFIL